MKDVAQQSALSARQAQIANLVVAGQSSREIAEMLHLSPRTVEHHLEAIFNKLGVGSRVELVAALLKPRPPQSVHPGIPPLRSVGAIPNNLPRKLTSFLGREADIAEITALVETHQLVTLVGSGGVGKTRTSLAVAEGVFGAFADGVWLIEFAPLSRGEYIPGAVAQALGLTLADDGDPVANLARALKSKHLLLVFDNCEHLVTDVAKVVAVILNACHAIKILTSSRSPLRVLGEATYRMPSMPVPPAADSGPLCVAAALSYVAVALFVDRARAVDNRFALTGENSRVVADICRRLDGIPLAIELAAVRVKILSPRQLHDRLDERFRVLTGGNGDLPRHQTLRALISWSYDLLDERERVLFRRLGIFVNGFTLEGSIAVAGDEGGDEFDVVDDLASLVDKSLVIAEPDGSSLRYHLLESTRAYALEELALAGEHDLLAGRHLKHFRDCFSTLRSEVEQTMRTGDFEDAFLREYEDVRVALDWGACSRGDIMGAELLAQIGVTWVSVGTHRAGVQYLETYVAALPESEFRLRSLLSSALSVLLGSLLQHGRALELAELAVGYARKSGDAAALVMALSACATRNLVSGRFAEAGAEIDEAEAISKNAPLIRLRLLFARAWFYRCSGDWEHALRCYEQLRWQYRSAGDVGGEFLSINDVAELEYSRGGLQRAITLAREALATLRPKDSRSRAQMLTNLAGYLCATEELSDAADAAREVIHLMADRGDGDIVVPAIEHIALVYALRGNLLFAAVLAGYANRAFQRMGFVREFTEQATRNRLMAILVDRLAPNELEQLTADGSALTPEAARELALGQRAFSA